MSSGNCYFDSAQYIEGCANSKVIRVFAQIYKYTCIHKTAAYLHTGRPGEHRL
jgi:hypothetical protein